MPNGCYKCNELNNYFNVPLANFTAITDAAIAHGSTLCWEGDATSTGF
jgi:hypothetical protein